MKKLLMIFILLAIPVLSFPAIGIGVSIPIGGGPAYGAPMQALQGTVVQSSGHSIVLQLPDGSNRILYLTNQTQIHGSIGVGVGVSVNAWIGNRGLYAQSINALSTPYNYAYPSYAYPVYPYYYGYPGYYGPVLNFGLGFGGHGGWGGHGGGHAWGHGGGRH